MSQQELLSVSDFFVILFKRKWLLIVTWLLVMAAAVGYLMFAKKTYRLTGTIYVGRFQEILLEEGEFVAHKLEDYSFIKKALDNAGIQPGVSIGRLQRLISTEVLNEIKKIKDVGLVSLTVDFKDRQMTYEIFKALTDQLIADHGELLGASRKVFQDMEAMFWENERLLKSSIDGDESLAQATLDMEDLKQTVPSQLLIRHTVSEKSEFWKTLVKDIHYLKIEADSATKSYNTKLAADPQIPDDHYKPKTLLTLILAVVIASIVGVLAVLFIHIYQQDIRPRLSAS